MSKGRSARVKGHSWEREIANRLKPLDPSSRRNVSESQEGSFDILTELPLALQCKCLSQWRLTPHAIWQQAKDHAGDRIPAGVVKIDRKKPELVILAWDDFYNLVEAINENNLWGQFRTTKTT